MPIIPTFPQNIGQPMPNRSMLSAYFKYRDDVRIAIYTAHAIVAVHHQFRKPPKNEGGFAKESSLLKIALSRRTSAEGTIFSCRVNSYPF
jgi:transposase-like protein